MTILGFVFVVYLVVFGIYLRAGRTSRDAFVLWFPAVATPILVIVFFVGALLMDPGARAGAGPGGPLGGVVVLFAFTSLAVASFCLRTALRRRPTAADAFRPALVIPTVAVYLAAAAYVVCFIRYNVA